MEVLFFFKKTAYDTFALMKPPAAQDIFSIRTPSQFEEVALALFRYQFEHNTVYRSFCDLLYKHPSEVNALEQIPFLPINFFKTHQVVSGKGPIVQTFSSSGTTSSTSSKHYVSDLSIYQKSYLQGFQNQYGPISEYTILALLPSYLEREGSSLIYMVDDLIKKSKQPDSGFYLDNFSALSEKLRQLDQSGNKVLLIGVSFALLDLVEIHRFDLKHTIVMETGGMKGRRKEIIRAQLHDSLKAGFGVKHIHSEYGMTELLSQAYSKGEGIFETPPWMQVFIRDPEDPLTLFDDARTGGLNIIDLANVHSCAFIATQDLGKKWADQSFAVLGRFDNADIRGCNLMAL